MSFSVQYSGASVSVATNGKTRLHVGHWNEIYEIDKRTPNLLMKNLIFGKRRLCWEGDVNIVCPKTSLEIKLTFRDSAPHSAVEGFLIGSKSQQLGKVHGTVSDIGQVYFDKDQILVSFGSNKTYINYHRMSARKGGIPTQK